MANENLNLHDLRALLAKNNAGWQAGDNPVSRLSEAEKKNLLGYKPGPSEPSLRQRENIASANFSKAKSTGSGAVGFASAFDWRTYGGNNYITSVKDQRSCGSCVAFGTLGTMEGMYQIIKNNPNSGIDLSEAQLFYCNNRQCFAGDPRWGWWVGGSDGSMNALLGGIADEACYPYVDADLDCSGLCGDWASRAKRISAWHEITDHGQMKDWLSTRGPLTTCFTVYDDFFSYSSGIYHYASGGVAGGHCVCVVGYSEDQGGYWICKNQWGTGFGESGYFCIGYGEVGIDASMWAIDGIVDEGWLSNKLILGLWSIDQDRNAYVYVDGEGWKKVANDNDNIFLDMLSQLISAKASGKTVSLYISYGVITQIYVNS